MSTIKSVAERIKSAQATAEDAMTSLLFTAERYSITDSADERSYRRRELLKAARRYGRAMDRLTVVRR